MNLAAAAVERIESNDASLELMARDLGVTPRHLRREIRRELGISPIALAQTLRLTMAKQLIVETRLPITEVAFASGFRSVRRFNALFRAAFGKPPSALRRHPRETRCAETLAVRFDSPRAHAWPRDEVFSQTMEIDGREGWVAVYPSPDRQALIAEISLSVVRSIVPIVAALRKTYGAPASAGKRTG